MTTRVYITTWITSIMDQEIINYFHHIHHLYRDNDEPEHEVHHCGGDHAKLNPDEGYHCCDGEIEIRENLRYTIRHCRCNKHSIDKKRAVGHDVDSNEILVLFVERCPEGGYHVESGIPDRGHIK
jgi:hypothetical protein